MIESVKITLLLCLTVITSCVLFLSYGEYTNRYEIVTTQNNGVYIFDKKTVTLNKCENGKCEVILANFPTDRANTLQSVQAVQASGTIQTQNTPITTASTTSTLVNPPIISSPNITSAIQPSTMGQNNTTNTTMQPKVNSFLSTRDQLPTLQSSLEQSTYGHRA